MVQKEVSQILFKPIFQTENSIVDYHAMVSKMMKKRVKKELI